MILFSEFPREICFPQRYYCPTKQHFLKMIKSYNGRRNIYCSLYSCNKHRIFDNAIIDKIFFDFDGNNALKHARKLVKWCMKYNYKFCILFSGKKGFHIHIFCKKFVGKSLLKNAHIWIEKQANVKNDIHVVGDISRICRVPNTFHLGGQKFCISLHINDLKKDLEEIHKIALYPRKKFFVFGHKKIDVKKLPKIVQENSFIPEFKNYENFKKIEDENTLLQGMAPCIISWLVDYDFATHRNRFYFALACAHSGLSPEECKLLAKKYYSRMKEKNGKRSRYIEFINEKAIEYAYTKGFLIPNCENLISCQSCPGKCKYYQKNNFPLYK